MRSYEKETLATYVGEETNSVHMYTLEMSTFQWKFLLKWLNKNDCLQEGYGLWCVHSTECYSRLVITEERHKLWTL